jgi:hypothetical protein
MQFIAYCNTNHIIDINTVYEKNVMPIYDCDVTLWIVLVFNAWFLCITLLYGLELTQVRNSFNILID